MVGRWTLKKITFNEVWSEQLSESDSIRMSRPTISHHALEGIFHLVVCLRKNEAIWLTNWMNTNFTRY